MSSPPKPAASSPFALGSSPPPPPPTPAQQQQQQHQQQQQGKRRRKPSGAAKSPLLNAAVTASLSPPAFPPASPMTPPAKRDPHTHPNFRPQSTVAADMSVLVSRLNLYDSAWGGGPLTSPAAGGGGRLAHPTPPPVAPFRYIGSTESAASTSSQHGSIAVCHVPPSMQQPQLAGPWMQIPVVDKSTPCPYANSKPNLIKYWHQRRRLFSRFDQGIELDEEGWFSVTPEQIAHHVAEQIKCCCTNPQQHNPSSSSGAANTTAPSASDTVVVLDAFCGCGGNAIALAQQPGIQQVVGIDVDRSKLRRAAHNAAIYGIPAQKLVLIECNVLFVLEHCYKQGQFVLDQPLTTPDAAMKLMNAMPAPVPTETCQGGYQIGGIDLLPRAIHAIFMDPPWGGVDYEVFGKHGYDLERNMKIARPAPPSGASSPTGSSAISDGVGDDFFDSFAPSAPRNKQERRAQFNCTMDESNCVNGCELLALAAAAVSTETGLVAYDVPRNTNRQSLGLAALAAGYRGSCRWDEHYLNGRLKTVTAYFGRDWSGMLQAPHVGMPPGGAEQVAYTSSAAAVNGDSTSNDNPGAGMH